METSVRQPTKKMIEQLKRCHEMQLEGIPCFPEHVKSSLAGLYKRGFVGTKMQSINNKNLLTVFVTREGQKFLERMYPE